jgi:hypothetical protein
VELLQAHDPPPASRRTGWSRRSSGGYKRCTDAVDKLRIPLFFFPAHLCKQHRNPSSRLDPAPSLEDTPSPMGCSEAPPWISTSPRQAKRAGKLPVDAGKHDISMTGHRRSPSSDLRRPRWLAPRHRGELLIILVFFIVFLASSRAPARGHLHAPPFGHAAGDAPRVKTQRGWYPLTRLDLLDLFPALTRSNLQGINGFKLDL